MDALAEQPTIHDVGLFPVTQRHLDYVLPETDLYSCPPIFNRKQVHSMYPECFNGIGNLKNYKYHITLEDYAKPLVHPIGKTALDLRCQLVKQLLNMADQVIIAPVGHGESGQVN